MKIVTSEKMPPDLRLAKEILAVILQDNSFLLITTNGDSAALVSNRTEAEVELMVGCVATCLRAETRIHEHNTNN